MIYGVYLAYNKWDVLPDEECRNPDIPNYPPEIARVRMYRSKLEQMEAYANTHCPASQTIEATTEAEFNQKVEQMKKNFLNEEWLKENIEPYI